MCSLPVHSSCSLHTAGTSDSSPRRSSLAAPVRSGESDTGNRKFPPSISRWDRSWEPVEQTGMREVEARLSWRQIIAHRAVYLTRYNLPKLFSCSQRSRVGLKRKPNRQNLKESAGGRFGQVFRTDHAH